MQVLLEQLEIGPDPAEVGRARRWARSRLAGAGVDADESLAETLLLLISELVTNAVVHTGCPAVLCMLLPTQRAGTDARDAVGSVRVEVADTSTRTPHRRQAEGGDTNGRGLELVCGLADRWGWEREPGGKRVWCELDTARPALGGDFARGNRRSLLPEGGRESGPGFGSDRSHVAGVLTSPLWLGAFG
ncbi:ATP-binding protein [Streptomyces axinellae]|uniref:Histidine kinase/HSP90-like ATPase domain-containing protein n=1 Tax=Streptomyces axinellae TaxID=552788 RepID=A0ABP6DE25_9ACTN